MSKEKQRFDCSLSGCSLVVVLISENDETIYSASVGNARAALYKIDKRPQRDDIDVEQLTVDHDPSHPRESKRIRRNGGEVRIKRGEVQKMYLKNMEYPGLHLSRSIGDKTAHSCGVVSEPGKYYFPSYSF